MPSHDGTHVRKWPAALIRGKQHMALRLLAVVALALSQVGIGVGASGKADAAALNVNLDQFANLPTQGWQNGDLNGNNSAYQEGRVVPFRLAIDGLSGSGTHSIHINYDFTAGGHEAYDFLASYKATENPDVCSTVSTAPSALCPVGSPNTLAFPDDTFAPDSVAGSTTKSGLTVHGAIALAGKPRALSMWGGAPVSFSSVSHTGPTGGDSSADLVLTFDTGSCTSNCSVLLAWGGHLAQSAYWMTTSGDPNGAGQISGAPFHMRTQNLDNSGNKNQDRSIQPSAIVTTLTVNKVLVPSNDPGLFNLLIDGTVKAADIGNGGTTGAVIVSAGAHTVSETAGANTSLGGYQSSVSCIDPQNIVIASSAGTSLSILVQSGINVACTFTNVANVPPTDTPTATATATATNTSTSTPTDTNTPTATNTSTSTPTDTATPTNTATATDTFTPAPTDTGTALPTDTATNTATPTDTFTPVPTGTSTPTSTATDTPTATATNTSTNTPVPIPNTPTSTATNTATATATSTPTNVPVVNTDTSTSTATATSTTPPNNPPYVPPYIPPFIPSSTPTTVPTSTDTPVAMSTATPADTATASATDTPVPPATETATPVPSATSTGTAVPTDTPTAVATDTETPVPAATSTGTAVPTDTPPAVATDTDTPAPTDTQAPAATATDTSTPVAKIKATVGVTIVKAPTSTPTRTPKPRPTQAPLQLATATPAGSGAVQVATNTPIATNTPAATNTPKPKIQIMPPGNTNASEAATPRPTTAPSATSIPSPTAIAYVVPKALPGTGEGGTTGTPGWFVLAVGTLLAAVGAAAGSSAWLTFKRK